MKQILYRIFYLLTPKERKTSIRVVASILVNTLLDFISLAALLPVLYYLLEGMKNAQAALLFCGLAIGVILLKCILSTWLVRFQNLFLLDLYKRLSYSLYSSYYRRGLLFIREQGSNRLNYEVNAYCYAFSLNLLAPMAVVLGDGLLVLLVVGVLFVYASFTACILAAAFFPFFWMYTKIIRKRVKEYGEHEQLAKREQYKLVGETFQGYAELKVSNAFPIFSSQFLKGMQKISDNRLKMITLMRLPLLLSEFSVVIGLALLVWWGEGDVKILIGIFALAAFRLLPAMRSIFAGWTQIQNSIYILKVIEDGLNDESSSSAEQVAELSFQQVIELKSVSYTYPNGEVVLSDFNARIYKGEQIGFSGYSGVGKSTLFNLLLGFLTPTKGTITIDGVLLSSQTQTAWLEQVGYVSQEVFLFNGTLAENITIGCKVIDNQRIRQVLSDVSLLKWVESLPEGVHTILGERGCKLSGGQRQRIGIARALYRDIQILFLDEATSSLDDETEAAIICTLTRLKKQYKSLTILSIAHRKTSLSHCDRIIKL